MKPSHTRKSGHHSGKDRPLEPDEVVALEAARSDARSSPQVITPETRRPFMVSALDEPPRQITLRPSPDIRGAYVADSTSRLVVGALGRSGDRLPPSAAPKKAQTNTPPKRPRHATYSYLPRIVPRRSRPLLRSVRGVLRPENVYGSEDRVTFWPNDYPWFCAGKLFAWTDPSNGFSMSSGSAVLVGPRHVLTAGHMCPWYSNPWQMLFVPGYYDGKSVVGIDSYVSDYRGWDTGKEVEGNDIALLRLYDPIGDELGWFGSQQYQDKWQDQPFWGLIGWPLAVGGAERPTFQGGISVLRSDTYKNSFLEIMHHGDSSVGNSGGPLYSFWDDGFPYVIGAHSGTDITENKDFNAAAGGRAMVDLIRWGLEHWP